MMRILSGIFFTFILAIIFVLVNPDYLKPYISAQFAKYTGCEMKLDDQLSFSFFPYFGVKLGHIQIIHSGSVNTIDIKNAVMQLSLLPLLQNKIKMGSIQMDELSLNQHSSSSIIKFSNVRLKISPIDNSDHSFEESSGIQANVRIRNMKMSVLNIDNIYAMLHLKNNKLNIQSIHAEAYGGYLAGLADIDFNTYHPIMSAHVRIMNVQIEGLLKLVQAIDANIYPDTRMSGTGNMEFDISMAGETGRMMDNLNGRSHLVITNGMLMGKDWDDILAGFAASNQAVASEALSQNFSVFRFKRLSASFKITRGIFYGDDLLMEASDVIIKGKGQINLPDNFIDYVLQAEFQNSFAKGIANLHAPVIARD